nr:hypothetical protein [Tanacetum cinerariifolium]
MEENTIASANRADVKDKRVGHIMERKHSLPQSRKGAYDIQRILGRRYSKGKSGRYGVSVPALTKDHKAKKFNTPYPEKLNTPYSRYSMLEEEKACRCGKVYNWKTTTYGKIWDNEDVHDLISIETEFPAIVFNDTLT